MSFERLNRKSYLHYRILLYESNQQQSMNILSDLGSTLMKGMRRDHLEYKVYNEQQEML